MVNNSDNSGNNGGIRSKFRDRLRLIRVSRYKKIRNIKNRDEDNKKFIEDKVKEIKEAVWRGVDDNPYLDESVVVRVRGSVIPKNRKVVKNENVKKVCDKKIDVGNSLVDCKDVVLVLNKDKDVYIDNVNKNICRGNNDIYETIKNTRNDRDYAKRYGVSKNESNNYKGNDIKKTLERVQDDKLREVLIDELRIKIIKRLKKDFESKINELEVLESELYFIEKDNNLELDLEKVKVLKKEINDIIGKINNIIREYNIYNNNYGLENVVDLNDGMLVDDIINFKYVASNYFVNKNMVRDYKLLDEYQELYYKLDYISVVVNNLVDKNQEKIDKYDIRDKKYNKIKEDIVKSEDVLDECNKEIDRQNEYFKKLVDKVGNIDKNEYVTYKFKGISNLVGNSLKYLGLLMVRPLAGLVPSIAVNTLATRKVIQNICRNIGIEEIKKVEYKAVDYEKEINDKLSDIDFTYDLIDDTVRVIDKLRDDFMLQYNTNIKGYDDTLRKIDAISDSVVNNREKLDIIKKNLIVSKKINADKLGRVKKLNKVS